MLCADKAREPYNFSDYYEIKTTSGVYKLPSAIVLHSYIVVPFKRVQPTRKNILRRDYYECQYCAKALNLTTCTLDHVMPESKGGKSEWLNLVSSCKKCNSHKGNRLPHEAGMKLRNRPWVPTREYLVMSAIDHSMNGSWKRWAPQK